MKSKLSYTELASYFAIWLGANIYCLMNLYKAQSDVYKNNYDSLYAYGELRPGWRFISRWQDVSDFEWSSWKYFIQTAWLYLLFQFFISEFIRKTHPKLLKYWYIISSILFIVLHMDFQQLLIILIQPVIFTIVLFWGGKKASIWITSIILLMSYNLLKDNNFLWNYFDYKNLHDEEVYLLLFTIAWIKLRCISFCIDYIDAKENIGKKNKIETILNMFSYVLYTPVLYIGPIILYEEFKKSFCNNNLKLTTRLRRFMWDMFLFYIYTILLDFAFHYIYFLAMQSDIEAVKALPTLALCGGGLWMGLEFHLKYVISYGTTTAFARLDNLDPPPTPRCIARVHVYSQMWRYFDVGLYRFLVKYIHKPALSFMTTHLKLAKILNKLIASLTTFVFIFMWHGTMWNIFVWSTLNYLGITLESIGKVLVENYYYKLFKKNILKSDAMEIRFIAILCTPLLALSAISNFYLFAGSKVGNIYFECFTHPTFFNTMLVSISLYSCCHVSMALQDVPSRTDYKSEIKQVKSETCTY